MFLVVPRSAEGEPQKSGSTVTSALEPYQHGLKVCHVYIRLCEAMTIAERV